MRVIGERRPNRFLCWFLAAVMLFAGVVGASASTFGPDPADPAAADEWAALRDICSVNGTVDGDGPDRDGRPHCVHGLCCSIPALPLAAATVLGPSWEDDASSRRWFAGRTAPLPKGRITPVAWARGPPSST